MYSTINKIKNLLSRALFINNSNAPFSTFLPSTQGEGSMKATASASCEIQCTGMINGKIYMVSFDFINNVDSTAYPYILTASQNTLTDGQSLIQSNNAIIASLVKQGFSICLNPTTNSWLKIGGLAGQSFKIFRPKIIEDRNWTENIFNAPIVNAMQNGDFTVDASGWIPSDATLSSSSGSLKILNTTTSTGIADQSINTIVGQKYVLDVCHRNGNTTGVIKIGSTWQGYDLHNGFIINDVTSTLYSIPFTAVSNKTWIRLRAFAGAVGDYTFFDNVSVTQASLWSKLKNHFRADCSQVASATNQIVPTVYNTVGTQAIQTTSTKQPICVRRLQQNGYNRDYLQFDSIDDTLRFTESIIDSFDLWFIAQGLPTSGTSTTLFSKGTGLASQTDIGIDFTSGIKAFYYDTSNTLRQLNTSIFAPSIGINLIRYKFNTIEGSKLYLNRVLIGSNTIDKQVPKNSITNCYFASRCDQASTYLSVKINEYLSFTQLTDNEANQVLKYLRNRYGNEANF